MLCRTILFTCSLPTGQQAEPLKCRVYVSGTCAGQKTVRQLARVTCVGRSGRDYRFGQQVAGVWAHRGSAGTYMPQFTGLDTW